MFPLDSNNLQGIKDAGSLDSNILEFRFQRKFQFAGPAQNFRYQ